MAIQWGPDLNLFFKIDDFLKRKRKEGSLTIKSIKFEGEPLEM